MLFRSIRTPFKNQIRYYGGSGTGTPQHKIITQEKMQKYSKFMTVEPDYKNEPFTLPQALQTPSFVKFLATSFSTREAESVSDTYYPPRLTDNSVFIYQSNKLGNLQRYLRSGDYFWVAFFLAGTSFPVFSAAVFGVFYAGFLGGFAYNLQQRLVLRADLLPHIDAVALQKVGAFGRIQTKVVQLDDLEHLTYDQVKDSGRFHKIIQENYFWAQNYRFVDHRLIFRSKQTKEVFLFDRTGLWSKEGVNHPFL